MKHLVVILDNGHGKNTKGKCSPDRGVYEWSYCRDIALTIHEELIKLNIDSILLVPEEKDISLDRGIDNRIKRANKIIKEAKAAGKECVLLSIHLNAAGGDGKWHEATGWSGWVANNASNDSKRMAQLLYDEAERLSLQGNRSVPKDRYWEANFAICRETNCPAILTENLFQDSKSDVNILLSEEGKSKLVELHVEAIKNYQNL